MPRTPVGTAAGTRAQTISIARARLAAIAIAVLIVGGPFFCFPELIPSSVRTLAIGLATATALMLSIALMADDRLTQGVLVILAITALVGWLPVQNSPVAISHFAGFGVGLLAMSALVSWCRTENRLLLVSLLFLTAGLVVLGLALAGTWVRLVGPEIRPRVFPVSFNAWLPYIGIDMLLPGIIKGAGVNKNALGATSLLVAPVAAALVFLPSRPRARLALRVVALATAIVGVYVFLVAESRAVWIAGSVVLIAACLRLITGWTRWVAVAVLVAVPIGGAMSLRSLDPVRFEAYSRRMELSTDARAHIWRQAVDRVKASYGLSSGFNQFRYILAPDGRIKKVAHAHNIFLQTTLDLGVIGAAAYVVLLGVLLYRADLTGRTPSPLKARVATGAGLAIVGIHVFGLGDAVSLGARIGMFQWLAAGLILASWHLDRESSAQRVEREP